MTPDDLLDASARDRILTGTDATLFVEAGAGSGKTYSLVRRICRMVLVDGIELAEMAAVTFTEKAAAELRERIRELLSIPAEDETAEIRERRLRGLSQVDTAQIGTLHAFALTLLTRNPLEAGVPPRLSPVDEMGAALEFENRWARVRRDVFSTDRGGGRGPLVDAVAALVASGVGESGFRAVAAALDKEWHRLPPGDDGEPTPFTMTIATHEFDRFLRFGDEILDELRDCTNPEDKLAAQLEKVRGLLAGIREIRGREHGHPGGGIRALLAVEVPGPGRGGSQANWVGGADQVRAIKARIKELRPRLDAIAGAVLGSAARIVATHMGVLLRGMAEERRRSGNVEFHDMLVLAAEFLRDAAVAERVRGEYKRILLDEFQDTDPLQLDIALAIAGDPADPANAGRLFTVGDPKQSIYRFRHADIGTYMDARGSAPELVSLTTNFRSTAPTLRWVNDLFSRVLEEIPRIQPAYEGLAPAPGRPGPHPSVPAPFVFSGEDLPDTAPARLAPADSARWREAGGVARIIHTAIERGWCHETGSTRDGFRHTPLRLADITILLPTRKSLPILEQVLDDAGIEFRAEASSIVYATSEIRELLHAVRAIADPADGASLVAALRSPLYGCSDADLLRWRAAGGVWAVRATPPVGEEDSVVAEGIRHLRSLADEALRPGDLLHRLVSERHLLEIATDTPRHRDVWRRIRFVIDQAHAWTETLNPGGWDLRAYCRWADALGADEARVKEAVLPEIGVDAVRISTIHASKGLEYPMVIVAGMTTQFPRFSAPALWDDDGHPEVHFSSKAATPGHAACAEAERIQETAEKARLLYVACTRASSVLAISGHSSTEEATKPDAKKSGTKTRTTWGSILTPALTEIGILDEDGNLVESPDLVDVDFRDRTRALPPADEAAPPAPPRHRDEWLRASASAANASALPRGVSATEIAHAATTPPAGAGSARGAAALRIASAIRGDGGVPAGSDADPAGLIGIAASSGTDFGDLLHHVLDVTPLDASPDAVWEKRVGALAEAAARRAGGAADPVTVTEVIRAARTALTAAPVRAAATRPHWKEMPLAGEIDGVLVEGVADLVYRDDDSSLVIVDHKTDAGVSAETLDAYFLQLAVYARLLRETAGERVSRVELVFCRGEEATVLSRPVRD